MRVTFRNISCSWWHTKKCYCLGVRRENVCWIEIQNYYNGWQISRVDGQLANFYMDVMNKFSLLLTLALPKKTTGRLWSTEYFSLWVLLTKMNIFEIKAKKKTEERSGSWGRGRRVCGAIYCRCGCFLLITVCIIILLSLYSWSVRHVRPQFRWGLKGQVIRNPMHFLNIFRPWFCLLFRVSEVMFSSYLLVFTVHRHPLNLKLEAESARAGIILRGERTNKTTRM